MHETPVPTIQPLSGMLTALLAVVSFASSNAMASEPAAIAEGAVDRMIGLNRRAYVEIQEQHFQAAKYHLDEALVISETAALDNDEMTARTYVHLAAVQLTGFKDRDEALRYFKLALAIDPAITITPGLESPALKLTYLQAREQLGLPPKPDALAPLSQVPTDDALEKDELAPAGSSASSTDPATEEDADEPDLPAHVPLPLYCTVPVDVQAEQDVVVRCVTQRQQKRASGFLFYRSREGESRYTKAAMRRTPKGWLVGVVPGRVVRARSLAYFVEARIPAAAEPLFFGRAETPNEVPIPVPASPDMADELLDDADTATLAEPPQPVDRSIRMGRLRTPGSVWIAVAGGSGFAYHGRELVDTNTTAPGTTRPVRVRPGFSTLSLFQIEPEIGFQLTRRFGIALMARYQYAPADADGFTPTGNERSILTSAFAGFLRGHITFLTRGRFEAAASVGAGGGTSFLATVRKRCNASECTLAHGDTIHGGVFGVLAGIGGLYRVSRRFGIVVDVREIATLPKVMAATEISVGLAFAASLRGDDERRQARATNGMVGR